MTIYFIQAGIEQQDEVLRQAPQALRDFFKNLAEPPWLDYEAFRPGRRAFHANVDLMLVAFVTGVLVEGFSTLIAKSFNITGRVASTKRRLQQNNRHMMDIFGNYILNFTKSSAYISNVKRIAPYY